MRRTKKLLSLLLTMVMVLSILPTGAFALEVDDPAEAYVEDVPVEEFSEDENESTEDESAPEEDDVTGAEEPTELTEEDTDEPALEEDVTKAMNPPEGETAPTEENPTELETATVEETEDATGAESETLEGGTVTQAPTDDDTEAWVDESASENQYNTFNVGNIVNEAIEEKKYASNSSDTQELDLFGNAVLLSEGVVQLTPLDFHQIGAAWIQDKVYTGNGLLVTFSYWAGGGHDNWAGGADGIVLTFSSKKGYGAEDGTALGFIPGSVGVEFDSYFLEGNDPNGKHVAIISQSHLNHLAYSIDNRVDDETWHDVKIRYRSGSLQVYLDGQLSVQAAISLPDYVYVGATASTGNGYNTQIISNLDVAPGEAIIVVPGICASELVTQSNLQTSGFSFNAGDTVWIGNPFHLINSNFSGVVGCNENGGSLYDMAPRQYNVKTDQSFGAMGMYSSLVRLLYDTYGDDNDNDYSEGLYDIHFFSYDWRMTVNEGARKLEQFINSNHYSKVILVCHSMGGLVASRYIANGNQEKVDKLITINTPYLGAPRVLHVLETGRLVDVFRLNRTCLDKSFFKVFTRNLPSTYELMPNSYYLSKGGIVQFGQEFWKKYKLYPATPASISQIEALIQSKFNGVLNNRALSNLDSLYSGGTHPIDTVDSYVIYSIRKSVLGNPITIGSLVYSDNNRLLGYKLTPGDGTVPQYSATLGGRQVTGTKRNNIKMISGPTHNSIIEWMSESSPVWVYIKSIIDGNGTRSVLRASNSDASVTPAQEIYVDGAANYTISDISGNVLATVQDGVLDTAEGYEYSFYPLDVDCTSMMALLSPESFKVDVESVQSDSFVCGVVNYNDYAEQETESAIEYYVDATVGQTAVKIVTNQESFQIDADGDGVFESNGKGENIEIETDEQTCGDNLFWTLDNGVLTISGTGAMDDYLTFNGNYWVNTTPWKDKRNQITSVRIESGVTDIGAYAFSFMENLTSVSIADSATSINNHAFFNCGKLDNVTIPGSITIVGDYAFAGCAALTGVSIGGVTEIGEGAFTECTSLRSVVIPDSVTNLGNGAFFGCTGLTSVKISNKITCINELTFKKCTGLTSITIPSGVTSIGDRAFGDDNALTVVTLPASVTSIAKAAFSGCSCTLDCDAGSYALQFAKENSFHYTINGAEDLSCASVSVATQTYSGKALTPVPKVVLNGSTLTKGRDYKVTYKNNTNAGKATVTVIGNGNYTGTASGTFQIKKAAITPKVTMKGWTYGKTAQNPSVSGNAGNGKVTYTYAKKGSTSFSSTKPTSAGDYTIKADVAETTNYKAATATTTFTISKASQIVTVSKTSATIEMGKTVTITGKGKGSITYSSANTNIAIVSKKGVIKGISPGTVKITIKAKENSNYKAVSKTVTIKVVCPKPAILNLTNDDNNAISVKWKKISGISGYEIQYSTSKTFKSNVKKATAKASATIATLKNLTRGKTWYVRIRCYKKVNGKNVYSAWSTAKGIKVKK